MMRRFACFGEVLWDVFPNHSAVGGAPLNVALRLRSLGSEADIISRIGRDQLGYDLLQYLSEEGMPQDYIQTDALLGTGEVTVSLDISGSATYDIRFPKAWDNIAVSDANRSLVSQSDALVFGSLSARDRGTRATLLELIEVAKFRVFDVNLRKPHYHLETIVDLMKKADLIKFNDEELLEIASGLGSGATGINDNIRFIHEYSGCGDICVTRGANGAVLFARGTFYENSGYRAEITDTVGAGDSFLATLLHFLPTHLPQKALDYACAMGALVASEKGANPTIGPAQLKGKISGN